MFLSLLITDYLTINCEKGFPKEMTTEAMTTGSQIVDHGLYGRDKERRLATIALPAGGLAIVILLVMGIVYMCRNRKGSILCRATQIHKPAKLIKLEGNTLAATLLELSVLLPLHIACSLPLI